MLEEGKDAEGGGKAFRIFFVCNSHSHITLLGYSKPLLEKKEESNLDTRSFEEIEAMEKEEEQRLLTKRS